MPGAIENEIARSASGFAEGYAGRIGGKLLAIVNIGKDKDEMLKLVQHDKKIKEFQLRII